jgi:hypothetical protein
MSKIRRLLASLVVIGLVGTVGGWATFSAFSSTTSNTGNTFAAGTVAIEDNDANAAMFTMANLKPGSTDTGCINVTFTGSLASSVKLYGTTTGTGLDQYLTLKVTRGTYTPSEPAFDACTNFSADATEYLGAGQGAGVIYNSTLQGFADTYTAGVQDPPGTAEVWTTSESHVYKFEVTVQDNNSAQNLNATQAFTWEAHNN